MLYGIAVVVIAAVIFLIVYNMKAGKSSYSPAPPNRAERKTGAAQNKDTGRTAAEFEKAEAAEAAVDSQKTSGSKLQTAHNNASAQPDMAIPRKKPALPVSREQSDNEYRQALRSFSGLESPSETAQEKEEETAKSSKDEAYREGLRSLASRNKQTRKEE